MVSSPNNYIVSDTLPSPTQSDILKESYGTRVYDKDEEMVEAERIILEEDFEMELIAWL